ncbi:hypothetical protein [Streptomyces sp. MBT27]|uniref:hypothetical protein n=1 Tax=Streptomyces sp. MBT27 TaxID=1488356 RepID=UPI001422976E|nr:hypothetical protein [Streptomyces sp. MBT27]
MPMPMPIFMFIPGRPEDHHDRYRPALPAAPRRPVRLGARTPAVAVMLTLTVAAVSAFGENGDGESVSGGNTDQDRIWYEVNPNVYQQAAETKVGSKITFTPLHSGC